MCFQIKSKPLHGRFGWPALGAYNKAEEDTGKFFEKLVRRG